MENSDFAINLYSKIKYYVLVHSSELAVVINYLKMHSECYMKFAVMYNYFNAKIKYFVLASSSDLSFLPNYFMG